MKRRPHLASLAAVAVLITSALIPTTARAASPSDPFYSYVGSTPLAAIKPGTVLRTRTVPYHIAGVPLFLRATQLLYRSTSQTGAPTVNVTSVVRPLFQFGTPKLLSYQSFYDSLDPADEPSVAIAGGISLGDSIPYLETALFGPLLLAGYTITIPDTQGQQADFAAGPEYGMNTLDSIRATLSSSQIGLPRTTKVGLMGYSGGAIATEWAAELASTYAPDISSRIVGSAAGGVLVHPGRNLHYVEGSLIWAGVMPMALVGLSRSFHTDLTPYLNSYGVSVLAKVKRASILNVLAAYPGLTWAKMAKPQYSTPESVPVFVEMANKVIMGTGGTPTAPLYLGQGNGGEGEGTLGNKPGIGAGDGVMIAGDVRALARDYCSRGVRVQYQEYSGLSHFVSTAPWLPNAYGWLMDRFAGRSAPSNCGSIKPGNSLAPLKVAG